MPTKILARDWKKQVLSGGNYLEIKGIHAFSVAAQKQDADTTDFESAGRNEHVVASRGTTITLEGYFLESSVATKASLTTNLLLVNNDMKFEAATTGTGGNLVHIEFLGGTGDSTLITTVTGNLVSVQLAKTAGTITSIASAVKASIEAAADPTHGQLTITYPPGNNGVGTMKAMADTYLAGGAANGGRDMGQAKCESLANVVSTTAQGTFRFITPGLTRWDFDATVDVEGPGGDTNAAASWKATLTVTGAITVT